MSEEYGDNVWAELADFGDGVSGMRLRRTEGQSLVTAVWELAPGSDGVDYHFHHGTHELLVVLRGRPTLRTPEGERQLEEGDVVAFPPGPEGAHTVLNRTDEPARYLMAAAHTSPDIIEYLDTGTFAAVAKTSSQRGEPFFVRLPLPDADDA